MSTPPGHPSRGRLALALTAAAAAAVPGAATAAPSPAVARAQERAATVAAPQVLHTASEPTVVDRGVHYGAASAASLASLAQQASAPAPAAPARDFGDDDGVDYYAPEDIADLELVKVTGASGGVRLSVLSSHEGLLRVQLSGSGVERTVSTTVRAGHHDLTVKGISGPSHLRVQATLIPSGEVARATASTALRLRR